MGVPDAKTVGHAAIEVGGKAEDGPWRGPGEICGPVHLAAKVILFGTWEQPVDLGLCLLRFGCRYLRVPHTLLMAVNSSAEVLASLRTGHGTVHLRELWVNLGDDGLREAAYR